MKDTETRVINNAAKKLAAFFTAALILLAVMQTIPVEAKDDLSFSENGVGYSSVLYDNSNGLPTSESNCIVQSDNGYIWIGGYSGLVRYDGNEFYYVPLTGISSVLCLYIDSQQRLWIGTNESGVAVFKNEKLHFYNRESGLRSSSIRSITEDGDGYIIIATTAGLAFVDHENELHIIDDALVNKEYVCELFTGGDGTVYGVTNSGGIFTVNSRRISGFYNANDLGLGIINTIYPDPENPGFVYLGSQESDIYYTDLATGMLNVETFSAAPLETINCIRYYDGALWVSSDSGIGVFDGKRNFTKLSGLPMTNSIDHIIRDYEGNLWFTSSRQGVMKIVDNRFIDISELASLPPLVVNSTCLCGTDLYLATDTGLYIVDKNYKLKENSLTKLLTDVRIRCIKRDGDGTLWLCTYSDNGLVKYDPENDLIRTYTENDGVASNRVRMLSILSNGGLAVATNAGLNVLTGDRVTATYGSNIGIVNLEILCVEEGENGKLYLGSDGDGIYVVDGTKVTRLGIDNGLLSEVILRIKKDPVDSSIFWIITSNSISYMKNEEITTVTSFPYSNNFDIYFDSYGRAWVLSSSGIYIVKRSDMLANDVGEYTLFDRDYGLPGITTANSYSWLTEDGDLYISASTGVYSVNVNSETGGGSDIKLSIPFISVDDKNVWIDETGTVHIPNTCKRLNIYANAFTYSLNNPHLSYYLEGFDSEPRYITKQDMTYASYTNLPGGTYTFRLSMINDFSGDIEKTVSITIIKDMAIYEQTWFSAVLFGIVLLGIVVIGFLIYRRKTAALIKKQEANRKLINEMIRVFSGCIDMKDTYTRGHSARVAKYTAMIAAKMGKTKAEVDEIYNIALLHDIGKIGIPDNILNKPGKLDNDEYSVMKSHAQRGFDILKEIDIDPDLALGAGYHHEKFDGTGYPKGLKGVDIPEIARMIAVSDAFDAMFSTRPYRKKMPLSDVAAELKRCSGTQFAPEVVDVFLKLIDEGYFNDANDETTTLHLSD